MKQTSRIRDFLRRKIGAIREWAVAYYRKNRHNPYSIFSSGNDLLIHLFVDDVNKNFYPETEDNTGIINRPLTIDVENATVIFAQEVPTSFFVKLGQTRINMLSILWKAYILAGAYDEKKKHHETICLEKGYCVQHRYVLHNSFVINHNTITPDEYKQAKQAGGYHCCEEDWNYVLNYYTAQLPIVYGNWKLVDVQRTYENVTLIISCRFLQSNDTTRAITEYHKMLVKQVIHNGDEIIEVAKVSKMNIIFRYQDIDSSAIVDIVVTPEEYGTTENDNVKCKG